VSVRVVQVRGCLPLLLALLVIGVVLFFAVTWSLAILGVAIVVGILAGAVRAIRRAMGKEAPRPVQGSGRASDAVIEVQVVPHDRPKG
jgi:membrane protein implicated in regulation of membrane protease activity